MDAKSYLMGIFDGEGSITAYRNVWSWRAKTTVVMTQAEAVLMFKDVWGGTYFQRAMRTKNGLIVHGWTVSGKSAIPFLEYAAENALIKRGQAIAALELTRSTAQWLEKGFRAGVSLKKGEHRISSDEQAKREVLALEIRRLNHRTEYALLAAQVEVPNAKEG